MGEAEQDTDNPTPVMCVHGWGGSFTDTWERNGFTALLADAGRGVQNRKSPGRVPKVMNLCNAFLASVAAFC